MYHVSERSHENGRLCCLQREELEDQAEVGRRRVTRCVTFILYKFSLFEKAQLNLRHSCDQLSGTITTPERVGVSTGHWESRSWVCASAPQNPRREAEGRPTRLCNRTRSHTDQLAVLVSSWLQIEVDIACFIKVIMSSLFLSLKYQHIVSVYISIIAKSN